MILQSCDAIADCQALAREIRATGSARGGEPIAGYNHLLACATPEPADALALQSVLPDVPACQIMSVPTLSVTGEPSSLIVMISGVTDTEVSPGCGYIIPAVSAASGSCSGAKEFGAVLAAPL